MSLLPLCLYFWMEKWTFQVFFFLMKFMFLWLQTTWKSLLEGTGDKNVYVSAGSWVKFTVFWLVLQLLFTERLWCARHTYNSHHSHLVFIFQMNKLVQRVTCPSSFINEQNWNSRPALSLSKAIQDRVKLKREMESSYQATDFSLQLIQTRSGSHLLIHTSVYSDCIPSSTRKATPHPNAQLNKEKPNLH